MKLLTKKLTRSIPALGSQGEVENPTCWVKFFSPTGSWQWFVIEASAVLQDGTEVPVSGIDVDSPDVRDIICFGLVNGFEVELGEFSMNELKSVKGPLGLGIERDAGWRSRPLLEVRSQLAEKGRA
jgi:hypothetical protein